MSFLLGSDIWDIASCPALTRGASSDLMHVRDASPGDDGEIAQVHVASRRAAWRGLVDDRYLDELDVEHEGRDLLTWLAPREAGWRILVADEDGLVRGFVTFVADPASGEGHAGALFVSPDRFRSGVGTSLLDAAAAALADGGCDEAILWTLEDDQDVLRFYRQRGWDLDGGRHAIELDQSRMVVRLRKPLSEVSAP
jgi:GNAT superfamily N-acetyltransferase